MVSSTCCMIRLVVVVSPSCIADFEIIQRGDLFLRDDENVSGGLCIDIAESQGLIVLIDDVGRNLAVDYFFKKRLTHILPTD